MFDEGGDLNMLYITLELDKTKNIFGGLTHGSFAATDGVVQIRGMIGLGLYGRFGECVMLHNACFVRACSKLFFGF